MADLAIKASGMVTAAGNSARATCAAIRAGVSGVRVDNIWDPGAAAYMQVGRPRVPQWWEGPDMLAELAAPAVAECCAALPRGLDARAVPVQVLLSPPDRPRRDRDLDQIVLDGLERRLGHPLHADSGAFDEGRTGILSACARAAALFERGGPEYVVVVGTDTFLRQRMVDAYLARRRILSANNSNGFIPGEAACAVLLAPAGRDRAAEMRIAGWGRGHEPGTVESERPFTGDGLTRALRDALATAGLKLADAHLWLTDQNAEHYKAKECAIAQIRLERRDRPASEPLPVWHPIDRLGEIGSAIGPCLLGTALAAWQGGYAPGPLALLTVGEDAGERAAFVLRWHEV